MQTGITFIDKLVSLVYPLSGTVKAYLVERIAHDSYGYSKRSIDKAYRIETPLVDGSVHRVSLCSDSAGGKGLNTARAVITCGEDALQPVLSVEQR